MVDVVDQATRSRMMSGIRSKNTKPELLVRSALHRAGFRFRLHGKLPGRPDLVFPKYRAVVFVHGCFWHGHDCSLYRAPGTRADFWADKISRNRVNDKRVSSLLLKENWRIAVIWECAIKGRKHELDHIAHAVGTWLKGEKQELEVRG